MTNNDFFEALFDTKADSVALFDTKTDSVALFDTKTDNAFLDNNDKPLAHTRIYEKKLLSLLHDRGSLRC